jgi:hypothetical protein
MDLDKVIFVDAGESWNLDRVAEEEAEIGFLYLADQIVRTDLKELIDEDLEGAPYGYAPMGDNKEEMEGFRFWKTGTSLTRFVPCKADC